MDVDKVMGTLFMVLILAIGFIIHGERNMSFTKRDAVEPLVQSIDRLQGLAFSGVMGFDKSIQLRLEIKDIIERINKEEIKDTDYM